MKSLTNWIFAVLMYDSIVLNVVFELISFYFNIVIIIDAAANDIGLFCASSFIAAC